MQLELWEHSYLRGLLLRVSLVRRLERPLTWTVRPLAQEKVACLEVLYYQVILMSDFVHLEPVGWVVLDHAGREDLWVAEVEERDQRHDGNLGLEDQNILVVVGDQGRTVDPDLARSHLVGQIRDHNDRVEEGSCRTVVVAAGSPQEDMVTGLVRLEDGPEMDQVSMSSIQICGQYSGTKILLNRRL